MGPNQGRGVASGFWFNAAGESSAQVNINEDGTVVVVTGHPDIGGSRASMVNIAAELLGIDYRQVQALIGDTSFIPFAALTGGSRVTFAAALVVTKATEQVIRPCASGRPRSGRSTSRRSSGRTARRVPQAPTPATSRR